MSNEYLSSATKIQFELSSMCNALCLGCVRTESNSFNDKRNTIPDKQYISFDVFKKVLESNILGDDFELEFCGTIDDPLMHPQLLEFLDWSSTIDKVSNVYIHTNGSLRNVEYWKQLAEVLKKHKKHTLKLSVDGLEDTNHLYRQNTNWKKIMENAQAYIDAGGNISWQYLIFPWNEHQIMEAKELSIKMGVREFVSRHDRSVATELGLERIQQKKIKNLALADRKTSIEDLNKNLAEQVKNEIACTTRERKMFFVGYNNRLWPCCFIHNGFFANDTGKRDLLEQRLFNAYGTDDWNNLEKKTVEEILNHPFYKNDLVESWNSRVHGTGACDRIHRCTEVCNVKKLEELPVGNYKVL